MARPWWPLDKRFWAKVRITGPNPEDCYVWTGNKNKKGYGLILLNGTGTPLILATHAALKLIGVEVPKGYGAFHICDNTSCVRVDEEEFTYDVNGKTYPRYGHIFIGPRLANNQDMWNKGRHSWQNGGLPDSRGTRNVNAAFTDEEVREIRSMYNGGGITFTDLALHYNVSISTISRLVKGITWTHVK